MILAQPNPQFFNALAPLAAYALVVLLVVLILVALLRWIFRVNELINNQQKIIELLRDLKRER
jgi:ABC-type multidrug transport system permease subunit